VAGEPSIHHSIHYVRVQTPTRLLSFPWESAQEFLGRCIAAYRAYIRSWISSAQSESRGQLI
jgi:hypothetical protein